MRILWFILLTGAAQAEALPGILPLMPDSEEVEELPRVEGLVTGTEAPTAVLMNQLQWIELRSSEGSQVHTLAPGIMVSSELILPSPRTLSAKLATYLDHTVTDVSLAKMADDILIHYDTEGFPVVLVSAPEQDLSGGRLVIEVEVGRIGRVGVSRPKFGNPESVRKGLSLRDGEILRRQELNEQLAWYGRTGFRKPRLFVSPGQEPATADILIAFEERGPWRVNFGFENSGPDLIGKERFVFGASGMLPNEHLLAWRGVLGSPAASLMANAIRWEIPLHRSHGAIQIDAAYAEVAASYLFLGTPVEVEGTSWSISAMHQWLMPQVHGWSQTFSAGFDIKGTDQFLLFGGNSSSPGEVILANGRLTHSLEREWEDAGVKIHSSFKFSPGNLGGRNDDAAFRSYDPAADSSYLVGNLDVDAWWRPVGDWRLVGRLALQASDSRLLPAEQFGAGGYQSVRGADERAYSMDNGWFCSVEAQTPLISFIPRCDMRLLTFFDQASVHDDGGSSAFLSSVGVGIRARVFDHVDLRFDHGWRLDESENRSHLGILVSF